MTEETIPWILTFSSGKKWADTLRSEATKEIYFTRIKQYCDAVGKNPDELLEYKIDGLKNITTSKEWQAEELLNNYLYNSGLTEPVKVAVLTAVKSFYKANWRELNSNVGSNISTPESVQRTPKMQDMLDLDAAMMYQRDRAILWTLESTAFRVGTLTRLLWKDLQPTGDPEVPYMILMESARLKGAGKGRYKGVKQVSFIHAYAAAKLEKYKQELKERDITINENMPVFVTYTHNMYALKGDPLKSLMNLFIVASLMAWRDLNAKRFSAHDMRDILQSALENARVNPNIVSILLAHKVKGVDKHYSSHDFNEFKEAFKSALPWLLPQTVEKVKAESDKAIAEQHVELEKLQAKYQKSEEKLSFLDSFFKLDDVIESRNDAQRILDFLEKLRREKLAKAYQEEEEEKADIADKLKLE